MKYLLYSLDEQNLVFDTNTYSLFWSKFKPDVDADRKILNILVNNNIKYPNNVRIELIKSNQLSFFKGTLKLQMKVIGELSPDIKTFEIESLIKNGGHIIIQTTDIKKNIIKVIPSYNSTNFDDRSSYNNKSLYNNYFNIENNNTEYIEAIVKIPKVSNLDTDTLGRIMESNIQIYKKVNDISTKLASIENFTENAMDNRIDENNQLLNRINQLEKNNEMLVRERALFEKEIKNAQQSAYIKIKDELKGSIAAITRIVDLDDYDFKKYFEEIIEQNYNKNNNKKRVKSDINIENTGLLDFTENIEAKIQSLKEIKKEFMKVNLLKD